MLRERNCIGDGEQSLSPKRTSPPVGSRRKNAREKDPPELIASPKGKRRRQLLLLVAKRHKLGRGTAAQDAKPNHAKMPRAPCIASAEAAATPPFTAPSAIGGSSSACFCSKE